MMKTKQNGLLSIYRKFFAVMIAVVLLGICCAGLLACGHAHEFVKVSGKQATCTDAGSKDYWTCSGCDELFADAEGKATITLAETAIAAKGHSSKKVESVAATCTTDGAAAHYKCSTCNALFSDAESKTATTTDAIKVAATGHDLTKVSAIAATCMTVGNSEYYECADCDKLFVDAEGKTAITADQTVIAKTAHDYELIVTVASGTYIEGTTLSRDKLTFALDCNDCDTTATAADVTVDLSRVLAVGENTFTATMGDISKQFSVTAIAKTLTDITLAYTGKTVYEIGEQFDSAGLTVSASYNNGQTVDVTDDCTVTADTSTVGDKQVAVSYGGITKTIDITVTKSISSLSVVLATAGKVFHVGETVDKSDLAVTATYTDSSTDAVTAYTITDAAITAETTEIEVTFAGKTARVDITVHAVTAVGEVPSTLDTNGTIAHYTCTDCGKLYNGDFGEVSAEDVVMPLMQGLSITDPNVKILNSNGDKEGLKTENGHTFLGGTPNKAQYGRVFISYNLTVDTDTDIKLYLNMCERTGDNRVNQVFSVKVNGVQIDIDDEAKLPQAAANGWFAQKYAYACNAKLLAGQNNLIEVTRLNLMYYPDNKGNYTYNFFGIGITPYTDTTIAHTQLCGHVCPHCGKCTDETSDIAMCSDKCARHEDEHFCESVCTICGDCTDAECTEESCASKCGCTVFTVMDDRVTVKMPDGTTVGKNTKENEQNVSANDSNAKKTSYIVTYTINSDVATTAKLYIKTCSQTIANSLAESYSFKVGEQDVTVDDSIMMPYNEANKWNDKRYTCVGEISLVAGNNTITITRPDMTDRALNDYTGYNFFGIALSSSTAVLTFA